MKTQHACNGLTVMLLTFFAINTFAQGYYDKGLKVLNPNQGNWSKVAGKFETIDVTVTPSGTYTNFDVVMQISAQNTGLNTSPDSLEAEYKFALPKGAILHNAVLWMNNIPVKATIYERNRAKMIYEALVSRRIDPLIIYQNDDYTFEARVYPIINPDSRKLSISFMVPNTITSKGVEVPVDMQMFRSDLNTFPSTVNVKVANNTTFGMPVFSNPYVVGTVSGSYTLATLQASGDELFTLNAIYFPTFTSGNFFRYQPTTGNEGYYQLAVLPNEHDIDTAHYVFVVDYRAATASFSYNAMMKVLQGKMTYHLKSKDQFNVLYMNNGTVSSLSPNWINGDTASINAAFASLPVGLASNTSLFFQATMNAVTFINQHGAKGNIVLLSNANSSSSSPTFLNQLINTITTSMVHPYPVNVFDFNEYLSYSFFSSGTYFYNNEYFFYNLALLTGGNYLNLRNASSSYYYYNSPSSFVSKLGSILSAAKGYHTYNLAMVNSASTLFADYTTGGNVLVPLGEAYMECGKYLNAPGSVNMSYFYGIDSNSYVSNSSGLSATPATDTFTKKIWGSLFIDDLDKHNSNNLYNTQIVNNSINYDVLCTYTALLALEPDTAGTITNDVPTALAPDPEKQGLAGMSAYPNPFSSAQTIELLLTQAMYHNDWKLTVFNPLGEIVWTSKGKTTNESSLKIQWPSASQNLMLPKGMYMITLQVGNTTRAMRVVKE